jgi:hypothetical protein
MSVKTQRSVGAILNVNPLENISNTRRINKVYLRGQEVDRAELRAKWQMASRKTK